MHDAFLDEDRLGMRGRARGLGDADLVDAGAIALSKDRSTEKAPKDYGFGLMLDSDGRPSFGDAIVARNGAIGLHGRQVIISTVFEGQRLGLREVDTDVWLVSFMHYDLGYIDLEARTLQTIDTPFGSRVSPM